MFCALALLVGLSTLSHPGPQAKPRSAPTNDERAAWQAAAARCGEEISWAGDWDTAARRAREEQKPVLAVAWMFDDFEVTDGAMTYFAMDPAVIELVNARFVPLALRKDTAVPFAAHELYGLSPTALGAALIVAAPDGTVLADSAMLEPAVAWPFLRDFLEAHAEFPGAAEPAGLTDEARAERHLARGELAQAARILASTPRTRYLQARLAILERDFERALAQIDSAREGADAELTAELERDQLLLRLALGPAIEARNLAERIAAAHPEHETGAAARHVLALLEYVAGDASGARARWSALVAERPESRWAWQAAVLLLAAPAELELGLSLAQPSPALLAHLRPVPFEPTDAATARTDALRWLRASQTAAGGFPDASDLEGNPRYTNHVSLAIDALAARALLRAGDIAAAERAHAAMDAERARTEAWTGREAMAYGSWANALELELVVARLASAADGAAAAALRERGEELAQELLDHQRQNGGWSYFYSTSLGEDAITLEQSISFVTATAVRALLHARAAGIELDEDALELGLACLEKMRDEDGVFTYMLWNFEERAEKVSELAEAAGRGPLCELALLEAGRSDLARLGVALERFFEHLPALAAERGKALMHCGPEGQGCHYVLFDYAAAAEAIARLPAGEREPMRVRLLERVLACRRADGAFLDAPVLGPTPGTALALLALLELGTIEPVRAK